jgi:HAD superfamily hydrolase (TIGR01509 family)
MQEPGQQTRSSDCEFPFCNEHGFRAIVFDWDGVLVDSGANYYRAYEMVLADAGITTSAREIYLREGQPTGQVLSAILMQHGRAVESQEIQQMVERRRGYDISLGERTFFAGTRDLLERLRNSHYRIGVVTGSSRKSVERLLTTDVAKLFDVIITADDVDRPKPDPEPFTVAASKLNVMPAECLVIENAPFGIRAAREAGCRVIALCTTLRREDLQEADWIALDHSELEKLLSSGNRTQAGTRGI